MIRIGIVREGKTPVDRRVPITPEQAVEIQKLYKNVEVVCQPSPHRCYADEEYQNLGISLLEDLSDCDILMGVKEVPMDQLIPSKTYFFFSHTIKAQPYNQKLLQTILKRQIQLVDYEVLLDQEGKRIVAFGRYAGIVGAYNAIWTYGKRYRLFDIKRAYMCKDLEELRSEFEKISLPPIKIVLTGGGRVSKGAMEILYGMGIRRVTPKELIKERFNYPVFAQLNSRDYNIRKDNGEFLLSEFFTKPEMYECDFKKYTSKADILISGAYWNPASPVLFKREDIVKPGFSIRVIADISCDIDGPIPSTKRASTIAEPVYDYDPSADSIGKPFLDEGNISVMAIDNLPAELPRDASVDFGRDLIDHCFPHLLGNDESGMIKNATIASKGDLTEKFNYLRSYVDEDLK